MAPRTTSKATVQADTPRPAGDAPPEGGTFVYEQVVTAKACDKRWAPTDDDARNVAQAATQQGFRATGVATPTVGDHPERDTVLVTWRLPVGLPDEVPPAPLPPAA